MNELLFFLPGILSLGIITSYQDIKIGKIRNKWIILSLIYAFITYAALLIYTAVTSQINTHYLIELVTNLVFSIFIGFGLWHYNIWSAGDGKLYIAYTALIPLSTYNLGYQEWIPGITLLINTFAISILFVFIPIIKKINKNSKKILINFFFEFFNPKTLINEIISLFAIYWIIQIFLELILSGNNSFFKFFFSIMLYSFLQKKAEKKLFYISIIISFLRIISDNSILSTTFLLDFMLLIITWKIIRGFIMGAFSKLGYELLSEDIKTKKLRPGMVLSETIEIKEEMSNKEYDELIKQKETGLITKNKKYYVKRPKTHNVTGNYVNIEPEGITKKEIRKIQQLGFKTIKISNTTPFAPILFLGIILTMLYKGNLLILVMNIFS